MPRHQSNKDGRPFLANERVLGQSPLDQEGRPRTAIVTLRDDGGHAPKAHGGGAVLSSEVPAGELPSFWPTEEPGPADAPRRADGGRRAVRDAELRDRRDVLRQGGRRLPPTKP
ncbi:hypothetical protein ACFWF9_12015 [Streptomyces roseolus]|uniref:hypothetical protein n=1 Tax=Streptomyces roseolus TaxID=67358 RepID=UPI0036648F67